MESLERTRRWRICCWRAGSAGMVWGACWCGGGDGGGGVDGSNHHSNKNNNNDNNDRRDDDGDADTALSTGIQQSPAVGRAISEMVDTN